MSKDKDREKRKREKAAKGERRAKPPSAVAPAMATAAPGPAEPAAAPKPPAPAPAADGAPLRRLVDAVAGARLCYGEPVDAGGRTVIPVARIKAVGGYGWGRGGEPDSGSGSGGGGGGGGSLDAQPVGFIELSPEGTRYHDIPDPDRHRRNLKAAAAAATAVLTGLAGARRLLGRRGGTTAGLLRSGR